MQAINTSRFVIQLVHRINKIYTMYHEFIKENVSNYAAKPVFHPTTVGLIQNIIIIKHPPYTKDTDLTKLFDLSPFLNKIDSNPSGMYIAQLVIKLTNSYYKGLRFHIILLLYRNRTIQLIDTQYPDLKNEIPEHSDIEWGIHDQVIRRGLTYIPGDVLYGKYQYLPSIKGSRTSEYNITNIRYELKYVPIQVYENIDIIQVYGNHEDAQYEIWGGDCEYLNLVILDHIIRGIPITKLTESPSIFIDTLYTYMKATHEKLINKK